MDCGRDIRAELRKLQRYVPFLTYLMRKHEENPAKTRFLGNLKSVKRIIRKDSASLDRDTIVRLQQVLQQLFDEARGDPLEYVKPNFGREPVNMNQLELLLEEILGNHTARTEKPRDGALAPTDDDDDIIEIPQPPGPAIPVITIEDDPSPRSPSPIPSFPETPSHTVSRPNVFPPPPIGIPPPNNNFQRNDFPNYRYGDNHPEVRVIPSERIRDANPPPNHWSHPPPGHHPFPAAVPKLEPRDYLPTHNAPQLPYPNATQPQHFPPPQLNSCRWSNPGPPPHNGPRVWEPPPNRHPPGGNFCQNRPPIINFAPPLRPNAPFPNHRASFARPWGGRPTHAPPPPLYNPPYRPRDRPFRMHKPWEPQREGSSAIWHRDRGWNEIGMRRRTVAPSASHFGNDHSSSAKSATHSSASFTAVASSQSSLIAPVPSTSATTSQSSLETRSNATENQETQKIPTQEIQEVEPMQESDTQMEPQATISDAVTQAEPVTASIGSESSSYEVSSTSAPIQASLIDQRQDSNVSATQGSSDTPDQEIQEAELGLKNKSTTTPSGSMNQSSSDSAAIQTTSRTSSETEKSDPSLQVVESYIKRAFSGSEAEAILAKIRKAEAPKEQAPPSTRQVVRCLVKSPERVEEPRKIQDLKEKKKPRKNQEVQEIQETQKVQKSRKVGEGINVQRRLIPRGAKSDAMCRLRSSLLTEEEDEKDMEDEYKSTTEEDEDTENEEKEEEERNEAVSNAPTSRAPRMVVLNEENGKEQAEEGGSGLKKQSFKKTRLARGKLAPRQAFGQTSWLKRRQRAKDIAVSLRKRVPVSENAEMENNLPPVADSVADPDADFAKSANTAHVSGMCRTGASRALESDLQIDQPATEHEETPLKEEVKSTSDVGTSVALPTTAVLKQEAAVDVPGAESPATPELIILYDSEEEREDNMLLQTEEVRVPDIIDLDDDSLEYVGCFEGNGWKTECDSDASIEEFIISSDSSVPGSPCKFDDSVPTFRQQS